MDVYITKENVLKIKGNKTTILIDPQLSDVKQMPKSPADVVILTDYDKTYDLDRVEGKRLVISGPGEYEVGGISINGKRVKNGAIFVISSDSSKVLLLSDQSLRDYQDDDGYDGIIIKVNGKVNSDAFSTFDSKQFILYGDFASSGIDENIQKVTSVNLKKKAEATGKVLLLSPAGA